MKFPQMGRKQIGEALSWEGKPEDKPFLDATVGLKPVASDTTVQVV